MVSPDYARAPDGPPDLKGSKLSLIEPILRQYRGAALKQISADPNVAAARQAQMVRVNSAYATKQNDPTGAKDKTGTLNSMLGAFGLGK